MSKLKKQLKIRNQAIQLFNRLNKDGRYEVKPWGYICEFKIPEVAITFCDKVILKDLLIELEEEGIELFLIKTILRLKRLNQEWEKSNFTINIRINQCKSKGTATICIEDDFSSPPKWVRFPVANARQLISHKALKVIHSNREAYISDFDYIDLFQLKINPEWFKDNDCGLTTHFCETK